MKKALFASAMFLLAFTTKSQAQEEGEFKPFKVDVSAGYALPMGGSGSKGGFLFAAEPKYAVMPNLSVGIRIEAAITVAGVDLNTGDYNGTASAKASSSYLATGDYYFTSSDLRPFAGVGAGLFQTAGVALSSTNDNIAQGSKFGGLIRAGAEFRHFRFGVEYNFVPKTSVAESTPGAKDGYTVQNAYLGVKFGVCIGGGRL
jgi:outer membrane protein W